MRSWHDFNIHMAGAGAGRDIERGFLRQSQRNGVALGSRYEAEVAKVNTLSFHILWVATYNDIFAGNNS
jgi:hypothetical protein